MELVAEAGGTDAGAWVAGSLSRSRRTSRRAELRTAAPVEPHSPTDESWPRQSPPLTPAHRAAPALSRSRGTSRVAGCAPRCCLRLAKRKRRAARAVCCSSSGQERRRCQRAVLLRRTARARRASVENALLSGAPTVLLPCRRLGSGRSAKPCGHPVAARRGSEQNVSQRSSGCVAEPWLGVVGRESVRRAICGLRIRGMTSVAPGSPGCAP